MVDGAVGGEWDWGEGGKEGAAWGEGGEEEGERVWEGPAVGESADMDADGKAWGLQVAVRRLGFMV